MRGEYRSKPLLDRVQPSLAMLMSRKTILKVTSPPENAIRAQKTFSDWQTISHLTYLIKTIFRIDFWRS